MGVYEEADEGSVAKSEEEEGNVVKGTRPSSKLRFVPRGVCAAADLLVVGQDLGKPNNALFRLYNLWRGGSKYSVKF